METPVSAADMAVLDAVAAAISADNAGRPDIWLIDADEATGTVTVGLMDRTAVICDGFHARYGPYVDLLGPPDQ